MVIPSLSKKMGGGTTSFLNYYKGLKQFPNVDVTVVSTALKYEINDVEQWVLDDESFKFFSTADTKWRFSKDLNKFLKKNIQNYDIVWIHAIWLSHSFFASRYCFT